MGKLVIATHKELTEMVTSLRAENEKLRAALKPFADMAKYYESYTGVAKIAVPTHIGDLRAAAAALKETGDE